ncbi:MAG: polyphenol oxidase family protein [Bacilli bacterium]
MYKWEQFKNILAVTTSREGGFSTGDFASLNLAFHVGDDKKIVKKNRDHFFQREDINLLETNTVFVAQNHSKITLKVTKDDVGRGYHAFEDGLNADALYTKEKGIALAIYHANCVPLFVYVPNHDIVGIIHAGELGSVANISGLFVKKLIKDEGVKPEEIYVNIGPSLSFSHRVITKKRAEELAALGNPIQKAVKATLPQYFLDLPLLNILQLREVGVPFENITFSNICTYENKDRFYHYEKGKHTGRNISFIRLNN